MIEDDTERHTDLLFNVRLAIRYHMLREAFYGGWHRKTGIISLVAGSAAVATITGKMELASQLLAASVAVAQAVDLMFETREMADIHRGLRARYLAIEPEILGQSDLDAEAYRDYKEKINSIEIEEPPIKKRLMKLCHNQTLHACGYEREKDQGVTFAKTNWCTHILPNVI